MEDDERSGTEAHPQPPWLFRGHGLNRVLALSDGVFAFAMTLLVLGLAVPSTAQGAAIHGYLTSKPFLTALYAYLISFFVIASWWQGHHLVFSYLRRYDRSLFRLNMVFLIGVAILPFATTLLNASGSDPLGVVVFSVIQILMGLALAALWRYASGSGHLAIPHLPPAWRRYVTFASLAPPVLFAVSIPFAFVYVPAAEGIWLGIFVVPQLVRRRMESSTTHGSGEAPPPDRR